MFASFACKYKIERPAVYCQKLKYACKLQLKLLCVYYTWQWSNYINFLEDIQLPGKMLLVYKRQSFTCLSIKKVKKSCKNPKLQFAIPNCYWIYIPVLSRVNYELVKQLVGDIFYIFCLQLQYSTKRTLQFLHLPTLNDDAFTENTVLLCSHLRRDLISTSVEIERRKKC